MYLTSFSEFFPETAARECRMFELRHHPKLPPGQYALLESYCGDPACDCRRVMLNVVARSDPRRFLASVSFAFDRNDEMAGPFLDPLNARSPEAEELLVVVKDILQDPAYVARLEEHYRRVKGKVSRGAGRGPVPSRVGRNAPCPCGSGRKYKKCCAGVSLPKEEYRDSFRDFGRTAGRKNARYMSEMAADPETLEQALEELGVVSSNEPMKVSKGKLDVAFDIAAMTIELNPEAGGMLLPVVAAIAAEHRKVHKSAGMALDSARRRGGARAAWALGELAAWPGLGVLAEKAGTLAREMQAEGILPRAPYAGTFSHAWATNIDGVGSRHLIVLLRTRSGVMDSLAFLLNAETGIKDLWCAFGTGARVEEDYRKGKVGMRLAPVSMELARELLGDALATHEARGAPPPGRMLLYRPMLGPEPIPIKRREPNLGAYALELLARGPELAADSEGLARDPSWRMFWCASDEAYEFVRRNLQGKEHPAGASWIGEGLVERFVREVGPRDRERLLRRMAINLETETWAGRAADPVNRLAARTWVVLSEELAPLPEVPYVKELSRQAIENISINLSMGFKCQREANERALAIGSGER